MKEPRRPAHIPKEAQWHSPDEVWRLGKFSTKPKFKNVGVGEWKYWTKEGHLCCIANFNDEGAQDGITERFHPDGSSASRGEWSKGSRHGHFVYTRTHGETNEDYLASYDTWRYEFDSENNWSEFNEQWYLEDGTECTSDGRPLDTAYDLNEVILACSPDDFLNSHAKTFATAFSSTIEFEKDKFNLAEIWGLTDSDNINDIDLFLAYAVEGDSFSKSDSRRTFEDNIWRRIINHPWENKHEELGQLFMCSVRLGRFGDSDAVYATIMHPRRNAPIKNAVYYWSHDTYVIDEVIAPDLDSFAYRIAVASACSAERISKEVAEQAWQKLESKANVGYFAAAGLRDDHNLTTDLDPKNDLRGPFWRSDWICYLLDPDSERDMDYVKDAFYQNWNPAYDDIQVDERLEVGAKMPSVAMYLLWRFFFFQQDDRLKKAKDAFANHSAKVVRDLVELLNDIDAGRAGFKNIKDILAVRRQFLELDLCPERGSERASEASVEAVKEKNRLAEFAKEVSTVASKGIETIIELAWSKVKDPGTMSEIEKHARKIRGYDLQWKAFDWAKNGGYNRANQTLLNEAFAVGARLTEMDTKLLQPFIFSRLYQDDLVMPEVFLVPICRGGKFNAKLLSASIEALQMIEKYNHKREVAVKILGAMGISSAAPHLCKLIKEYFSEMSKLEDSQVNLKTIAWDTLLYEASISLCKLRNNKVEENTRKEVRATLRKLLDHNIKFYRWKQAGAALDALVAWGETDLLEPIKKIISGSNDDFALSAALRAIESTADKMDKKERQLFAALEFHNPADHDNQITLLFWRAQNALVNADPNLGEKKDMKEAVEESLELSNYGDGWKLWRLTLCDTVAKFPELNINLIEPFLYSENQELRNAAGYAYFKRTGKEPVQHEASVLDIWLIENKSKDRDSQVDAVCALLQNPKTVERACLAFWLDQNPSAKGAAALSEVTTRLINDPNCKPERGEYTSSELEWLARALISHAAIKEAKETLDLCLKSGEESLVRLIECQREGASA